MAELPLSPDEQIVLTVARLFFQSFYQPHSMGWIGAMAEAEARFGSVKGPQVAARLLALLQAARGARRSVFTFNSPTCPCCAAIATEHERRLMLAIHGLRRGNLGSARLEVMMLCEGNHDETVLVALSALTQALDDDPAPTAQPARHGEVAR